MVKNYLSFTFTHLSRYMDTEAGAVPSRMEEGPVRTKSPFTRWRKKHKITQVRVAEILGIAPQYVCVMERGGLIPLPRKFARFEELTGGAVTHKMMIVWAYGITQQDVEKAQNI